MDAKDLCLELAYCDTEDGVVRILANRGFWDDSAAWRYYGDNENNFSTIGNQQSLPEGAVIEKLVNSVDAVLMGECMRRGIDPEGPAAPSSIVQALEEFYGIYSGKLSNLTPTERSSLAENICLVATGARSNPCYSVVDKGEGQTPSRVPTTLMSIGRSNKLRIPFVQGKFNMGGTGVLQFCGRHNLQFVLSRRDPKIAPDKNDKSTDLWGFTVVRRQDPSMGVRSSTYMYLAPQNEVLSFQAASLPLLPGDYPVAYQGELEWGTFIKLYEYQMTGLKTNILFDLYNRLSMMMPSIALPIRFYERRKGYKGHSFETTLAGLTVRLDEDRSENLEDNFPTSSSLSAMGQKMKASVFAFKKGQSRKYVRDEGILFTINGQTHGYLPKSFFTRRSVGMGYLADSILLLVDCTEIDGRSREDLFMNSRDRLRSGDLRAEIERRLEELVQNHQGLKELRNRRRQEEIEEKLGDSKPLAEVIENILKNSPALSKLFIDGVRLPHPFKVKGAKQSESFNGKQFPTQFQLTEKYPSETPKQCPKNVRFRVQYKTDAENEYFDRDCDPGEFRLVMDGEEITDYSINLWGGTANLNVSLPHDARVGNVMHFRSAVDDVSRIEPIENEFFVEVCEPITKRQSGSGQRKPPASEKEGKETDGTSYLDLPNVIEVRQNEWETHEFSGESVARVVDAGDGSYDFFINMDNIYLLTEQKGSQSEDPKLVEARYKYGMVLVGIALLRQDDNHKPEEEDEKAWDVFEQISYVTEAISPVLLPMISSLGDLQMNEDTVAV